MTFSDAIKSAPEGADFIAYRTLAGNWTIIQHRSDNIWDSVASVHGIGLDLITIGIGQRGQSLWNAESGQFEVGTAAQVML